MGCSVSLTRSGASSRCWKRSGRGWMWCAAELWTDVNPAAATKGTGLAGLQASLGISPAQTLCFGDFNNDIPMFEHARFSFAMANAQPDVVAAARYVAPSNAEEGVLTVLNDLFELGL